MEDIIKSVGILPWVGKDQHQINFARALANQSYRVEPIIYKKGFPLSNALKKNIDLLILDWVHSFFISDSLVSSLIKTLLQFADRELIRNRSVPIIWNMHNLHRHDKKFIELERYNFRMLAACVNGIRVFNDYSLKEVRRYLHLTDDYPIIIVPQGEYAYPQNEMPITKQQAGYENTDIIILFFGSIRTGKGLDKLIETFKKVHCGSYKLIIAGEPVEPELASLIEERVRDEPRMHLMNYFIPDNKVADLFQISDVVILPYENILNSGVQLLAHAYSKPILANDIPVFRHILNESYTEFFTLCNSESLSKALTRFKQRDHNKMQHASGLELKNRNWTNVVQQIMTFGESLRQRIRK